MGAIYIGGQSHRKNGGSHWKLYTFLILFLLVAGYALKLSAPTLVENWLNRQGEGDAGYAFSIRDVDLSLEKGKIVLKDVKVFNPETNSKLLEVPHLTIDLDLRDLIQGQDKVVALSADKVDLILSKDFISEMERIKSTNKKHTNVTYLSQLTGKIHELNIIEQKELMSRTILGLKNVNVKVKDVSLNAVNPKTEFSISSKLNGGGKLSLSGKTNENEGTTPWTIQGTLKQVPAGIFNRLAGNQLPFSFEETNLNAVISAHSQDGKISGEISPDIKRLNLLDKRPGIPTQVIARALTDELTFSLPFTLQDELTLEYEDTFKKLKTYRRYPAASGTTNSI